MILATGCEPTQTGSPERPTRNGSEGSLDSSKESIATRSEELSPTSPRTIPIRAIELAGLCASGCNPSFACSATDTCPGNCTTATYVPVTTLQRQIQVANKAFSAAGISFYLESWKRIYSPLLRNLNSNTDLSWSQVRFEIRQLFPGVPCNNWPLTEQYTAKEWLIINSQKHAPSSSVPLFITDQFVGGDGKYPWRGRILMESSGTLNTPNQLSNLGHELGHFLGLPHAFDSANSYTDSSNLERNFIRNTETNSWLALDSFWDLTYSPGNPNTFYFSKSQATPNEPTLVAKESWDQPPPDGTSTCTPLDANCSTSCTMNGQVYNVGDSQLDGVSFMPNATNHGTNIMGYRTGGPQCSYHLTASQIQQLQRVLRFDTKIDDASATLAEGTGKRPLLGQTRAIPNSSRFDVDGDGKRDIGVYEPPVNAVATGTFRIRKSSPASNPYSSTVVISLGNIGDVPVLSDFDYDGLTDVGVWRTMGPTGQTPQDELGYWVYCPSSISTVNCNSPVTKQFGLREDIPITETDFDGNFATRELAVYRPSIGSVLWGIIGSSFNVPSNTIQVYPPNSNDLSGSIPLVDYYNTDSRSDVVIYKPWSAEFVLRLSSGSSWGNPIIRQFPYHLFVPDALGGSATDRSGAVVSQGAYRRTTCNGTPCLRRSLQLWSPVNGTWHTYWDPTISSTIATCQWGLSSRGDIPISGFFGSTSDNFSSFAVYEPAFPNGLIHFRKGDCSTWFSRSSSTWNNRTLPVSISDLNQDGMHDILMINPDTGWTNVVPSSDYFSGSGYSLSTTTNPIPL